MTKRQYKSWAFRDKKGGEHKGPDPYLHTEHAIAAYYKEAEAYPMLSHETMLDYFRELRIADAEIWMMMLEPPPLFKHWILEVFLTLYNDEKTTYRHFTSIDQGLVNNIDSFIEERYVARRHKWNATDKKKYLSLLQDFSQQMVYIDASHNFRGHILKFCKETRENNSIATTEYKEKVLFKELQISKLREVLVTANLRFVVSYAMRYASRNQGKYKFWFADLLQDGNIGLIEAVNHFDPDRGFRFTTHALPWIKNSLHRQQETFGRTIRPSSKMLRYYAKIQEVHRKYNAKYNRGATEEEIIDEVEGLTRNGLNYYKQCYMKPTVSLQEKLSDPSAAKEVLKYEEIPADKTSVNTDTLLDLQRWKAQIESALRSPSFAPARTRYILKRYYGLKGDEVTYRVIGDEFGISRERVRQIINEGLTRLREWVEFRGFFLDECMELLQEVDSSRAEFL